VLAIVRNLQVVAATVCVELQLATTRIDSAEPVLPILSGVQANCGTC
jgi:hypothetical protein